MAGNNKSRHPGNDPLSPTSSSSMDQVILSSSAVDEGKKLDVPSSPCRNAFSAYKSSSQVAGQVPVKDSTGQSQGSYGMSQGSGQGIPIESGSAQPGNISKASLIRGRPNYKVANSSESAGSSHIDKFYAEAEGTGGALSAAYDKVPTQPPRAPTDVNGRLAADGASDGSNAPQESSESLSGSTGGRANPTQLDSSAKYSQAEGVSGGSLEVVENSSARNVNLSNGGKKHQEGSFLHLCGLVCACTCMYIHCTLYM